MAGHPGLRRVLACAAQAVIDDLHSGHPEAVTLPCLDVPEEVAAGLDVEEEATAVAQEVLVGRVGVGVVATSAAAAAAHLDHLAELDELVERVVDGRAADLGEAIRGALMNLVRGEVDVLASEHLGNDPALGGEPDAAGSQAVEEIGHGRILHRI
jgi:hypothetical protein